MPTGKRSRTYLAVTIGAFLILLVLAFLYMFVQFSGVGEADPAAEAGASETDEDAQTE
jgi:hypothetical protein